VPLKGSSKLVRAAKKLEAGRPYASRLSPLVFMTDPARVPDVRAAVAAVPQGAAIIYRHFGKTDRQAEAQALRQITFARGQQFLIGNDPVLAKNTGADGVHFKRDKSLKDPAALRAICPDMVITMAGLKGVQDYSRDVSCLDGLFISSVFASQSPSAGASITITTITDACRDLNCPVFALGGITAYNIDNLIDNGIAGAGLIEGLMTEELAIKREKTHYGHRFFVDFHPEQAELTMQLIGDDLYNANHTGVPQSMGGRGVGKRLVKAMVDDARAKNYKVIPGCPFVAAMFRRFPDWAKDVEA